MTNNTDDTDNIMLYCENNVFRIKEDLKLEKTGIPAYKLIIENCNKIEINNIFVNNKNYLIIINNVVDGGVVGLLIALNNDIKFNKDDIIFTSHKINTTDIPELNTTDIPELNTTDIPEFKPLLNSNKTSLFDKYYVESKKK